MTTYDFNDRVFVGTVNYDSGDLTAETRFHYRQKGNAVWGTCEGGGVLFGTLLAKLEDDGRLTLCWQYVSTDGRLVGGTCTSMPEILPDGRYRLHESWQVTLGGDESGTSVVEEVS